MTFFVEEEINTRAELAFDAMADVRNEVHWNDQVTRSALVSEEPIAEGSRFTTVNRGAEYDAVITNYQRPGRLEFRVRGKPMDIDVHFAFELIGSKRTRLLGEFTMRPKGVMRVLLPLMTPMVRKDFPKHARRFRTFCEKLAVSAGGSA